jgi:predicted porin
MQVKHQAPFFAVIDTSNFVLGSPTPRWCEVTCNFDRADSASAIERRPHRLIAIILVAMMGHPTDAAAGPEDPGRSMFLFSGFGTLGVVHSSEDRADFTASSVSPDGAGYTARWSPEVDSRIGAQIIANFTPQLSATLQVISEQNARNTYKPEVEWANIKYQLTPDFSVRVGRIVLPAFLASDFRKVGYANPWVRPPIEVYDLVPVSASDGVDVSYRLHVGDFIHTLLVSFGKVNLDIPAGGKVDVNPVSVISDTIEYGAATVHLSYLRARVNLDSVDALFDAFRQFGPQGTAIADKYDVDRRIVEFIGVGAMYDPGEWFVTAEWGRQQSNSFLGTNSAWFASGGYRLAKITPYVTYGAVKTNSNTSDPGLTISTLPPYLAGPAAALNAGLNKALGSRPVQRTISVGARWDFMKNVDFKLQFDHMRLGAGSPGTLSKLQPDFRPGGTVNLINATIDFVF